jgi:hypothetical protein
MGVLGEEHFVLGGELKATCTLVYYEDTSDDAQVYNDVSSLNQSSGRLHVPCSLCNRPDR